MSDDAPASRTPVLGPAEIQAILPHRYPILLVDRVDVLEDDRIVARRAVSGNEPFFQGHFPGRPVMPGVLLVEALAQAGGILALRSRGAGGALVYFMAIEKAKFRRMVVPGDLLVLEVVPLRKGAKIWKMRGEARVDGEVVCEAEFLATFGEAGG